MATWPVRGRRAALPSGDRRFASDREGGGRVHAGVDLTADLGDVLVATEDGVVLGVQGWAGPEAKALLFETDSGLVVLYGAVLPGSTARRGVRIAEGKPLAKVGLYPGGSSMLHMELYRGGTKTNAVWEAGTPQPEELLDPTPYLEAIIGGYRYVPPGSGSGSKLGPLVVAAASAGALWGLLGKR